MYDYVPDYAAKNVWCSPAQDYQYIIKARRISSRFGVSNIFDLDYRAITLPDRNSKFHIFEINQLHPLLIGLFPAQGFWASIANNCEHMKMIVDIYNSAGVQLPRSNAWFIVTPNKNLIVAVKQPERIAIDPGSEDIFFRVYTNTYFRSPRSNINEAAVLIKGKTVVTTEDTLEIQNWIISQRAKHGHVYCFINGYLTDDITLVNTTEGDQVEAVYDSSIKKVIDFTISQLPEFNSIRDNVRKHLIHPLAERVNPVIEYHDDLDFFLYNVISDTKLKGVYLHRNRKDSVRMVTHADYSVPVDLLTNIAHANNWAHPSNTKLRVHIRHSGYARPLIFEHNRIHELYRLDDIDIRRAMLGVDSTVPNWRAELLENSDYVKMMSVRRESEINRQMTEDGLGYNSISSEICMTPQKVDNINGVAGIKVPYGLRIDSTGYEYDENGKLLTWDIHDNQGEIYPTRHENTKLIEVIPGLAWDLLDEVYSNGGNIAVPKDYSLRFYTCPIVSGTPTYVWVDVTDTNLYSFNTNRDRVQWHTDSNVYCLMRSDRFNLTYTTTVTPNTGSLRLAIRHRTIRNGQNITQNMQIPMGRLDVFLNRTALIEGVDYIVVNLVIYFITKTNLVAPEVGPQEITIRFTGHCDKDLNWQKPEDVGFVSHGLMSYNHRYNVRDDKVARYVLGGSVMHRQDLMFAGDDEAILVPNELNGVPYSISDMVPALRDNTDGDTYEMYQRAKAVDKVVNDYLTVKFPQPRAEVPNAIMQKYIVVSPFLNAIIFDLMNGRIDDPVMNTHISDQDVRTLVEPYVHFLDGDPTQVGNELDGRYVEVHPHVFWNVIDLPIRHYQFVQRCVMLFMPGKIQLSHFLRIKEV